VTAIGHAYAVDPGDLWFAGRVTTGPRSVRGRQVRVHLSPEEASRLADELQAILALRRQCDIAGPEGCQ
jgi:hypothetical protein